jgi:hypothetical protein
MKNKSLKLTMLLSEQRPTGGARKHKPKVTTEPEKKKPEPEKKKEQPKKSVDTSKTTPGIRFASSVSTDINSELKSDLQTAALQTGLDLLINSTTTGRHADNSRHFRTPGAAVDIATFNGYTYKSNPEKFKELGNKLKNKLVAMGYTHNIENSDNPKSVLWYKGGDNPSDRHVNHIHVSNTSGTTKSDTDKKDDSAVTKYYWKDGETNWDEFFTVTVDEDEENLNISPAKPISAAVVNLTADNYDHQIDVNTDAYNFFTILYKLLNEDNAETYFSKYKSWNPFIGGDDEKGAAEYLDSVVSSALEKTGFVGRGNYADEAAVASMNMNAMYTYIVPHIRKLILNDNTGKATFPFINIKKGAKGLYVESVWKTITWNYM